MKTILDKAIDVLTKINFPEAQEVLNELRTLKMASMSESNVQQMKVQVYKAAQKNASAAYQALEGLDEADALLALVALLNKEVIQANQAD
jgi:rRNA maturation endonuclease Nob1